MMMPHEILISRSKGGCQNTLLFDWATDIPHMAKEFSSPAIGKKDGSYFLRCAGTHRNNNETSDIANIVILDGDSRINDNGEIKAGAPSPADVHDLLTKLRITHLIYSSYSNGLSREALAEKNIDSEGAYDKNYHKYRVIIPSKYSPEQLPALLDYLFTELHTAGVMLAPVSENKTWSQPWFFPRIPDSELLKLFKFFQNIGNVLDAESIYSDWLKRRPERPEPKKALPSSLARYDIHGQINSIAEFNRINSIDNVLTRNGYIKIGNRYLRPNSSSKIPGVRYCAACKDGILRIMSSGGDVLNDGNPHDAFDCYRILECNGNFASALNWDPKLTRHNQRLFMDAQGEKRTADVFSILTGGVKPQAAFSLDAFSLNGKSAEMETKMLEDKFVLGRLAILGQATVIYAKPNTGKTLLTLRLIINAILNKDINGDDVYYINADDYYNGMIIKLKVAERYGFKMLAPGHAGFVSKQLLDCIQVMVNEDTAHGKIIVLDTLKKFTNLMDKKTSSDFMRTGREFVAKGGTLILLAHTNKNRDSGGKVIFCGTSDIVDDVDCAYTLDEVERVHGTTKHVLFENIKSRGDVAREVGYSYSMNEGQSYEDLLNSVMVLDDRAAEQAKNSGIITGMLDQNETAIKAIINAIEQGYTLKTDLLESAHKDSGLSRARLKKLLQDHTGLLPDQGHLWQVKKGDKNAKFYQLLQPVSSWKPSANDYREARDGE